MPRCHMIGGTRLGIADLMVEDVSQFVRTHAASSIADGQLHVVGTLLG